MRIYELNERARKRRTVSKKDARRKEANYDSVIHRASQVSLRKHFSSLIVLYRISVPNINCINVSSFNATLSVSKGTNKGTVVGGPDRF